MSDEIKAGIVVGIVLMLLSLAGGGAYLGYQYKKNAASAEAATVQAKQSDAVTDNVIRMMGIINTVVQANASDKKKTDEQSSERIVIIRQAVSSDDCAKRAVPSAAVEQLRKHADKIRASQSGADTSGAAG